MPKDYKVFYNATAQELADGQWPKRYRAEFIVPGVANYDDVEVINPNTGEKEPMGNIFIGEEVLSKMNETYIGKPVVDMIHHDLTPEEAYKMDSQSIEALADGVVYEIGRLDNGWFYCDFIAWNQETQKHIDEEGYGPSCAYIVTSSLNGEGKYNEVVYDEEVKDGFYTHMAVVSNPRYTESRIYELPLTITNSIADEAIDIIKNKEQGENMGKLFRFIKNSAPSKTAPKVKNQAPEAPEEKDKPEMMNMEASYIETEDGRKIPLEEAVNAYTSKKNSADEKVLRPEDQVDIGNGTMVNVSDLIAACGTGGEGDEMKNAVVDVQDGPADDFEEVVKEEKAVQNSAPQKKQPNYFKVLKNAAAQPAQPEPINLDIKETRLERGKDRYSLEAK